MQKEHVAIVPQLQTQCRHCPRVQHRLMKTHDQVFLFDFCEN